jgi:hypothetical protein
MSPLSIEEPVLSRNTARAAQLLENKTRAPFGGSFFSGNQAGLADYAIQRSEVIVCNS